MGVIRLVSWNVNGIRACARKGFLAWLASAAADLVGLQEVRAEPADVPAELRAPAGFPHVAWSSARARRGYSGVAIFSKLAPLGVETSLGEEDFDREGRFALAELERLLVANVYFPKSGNYEDERARLPYKLRFTPHVFDVVDAARRTTGKPAVVMGDFNIAPTPLDLARPRENANTSGYLPEEREAFAHVLARGYVDTFRTLHPEERRYTWWSNRPGVRARNIGWRIDHVLVSADLVPGVERAFICGEVPGSDHCPLGIDLAV